jgi:hypothetical protein
MIGAALLDEAIERVLDKVAAARNVPDEMLLGDLRKDFPGLHVSLCREDDVPARVPSAAGNDACCLYYVASSDHCLSLTGDPAAASGLLVALLDQDEE